MSVNAHHHEPDTAAELLNQWLGSAFVNCQSPDCRAGCLLNEIGGHGLVAEVGRRKIAGGFVQVGILLSMPGRSDPGGGDSLRRPLPRRVARVLATIADSPQSMQWNFRVSAMPARALTDHRRSQQDAAGEGAGLPVPRDNKKEHRVSAPSVLR